MHIMQQSVPPTYVVALHRERLIRFQHQLTIIKARLLIRNALHRSVYRVSGSFPWLSAWTTQLRGNVAALVGLWRRHCV